MQLRKAVGMLAVFGLWAASAGLSAATLSPQANAGVTWLQSRINADGSFANTNGIATDLQAESEGLRTLGAANDSQASLTLDLISAEAYANTENLSRKIFASAGLGQNTTMLVASLLANQNPDGGFGEFPAYPSTSFDTSYALQALNAAGQGNTDAAHNAAIYLQNQRAANGSWSDLQGTQSAYTTSLAIEALSPYRTQLTSIAAAISAGNAYLQSIRQNGSDWGESFVNAQVILALSAGNADPTLVTAATTDLGNAQLADGSWGDDVFSTSLALRALAAAKGSAPPTQAMGSAQGYVVEAGTGRPIAGATVLIASDSQYTATTNGDGYYTLPNLPTGPLTFIASAPGYASATAVATVSTNAATQVGKLVLAQNAGTGMVFGRITSQGGIAVAGASIQLSGPAPYAATAGSDGAFALPSVAPGDYTLQISEAGYITVSGSLSVAAGNQYQINQSLLPSGSYQSSAPVTVSANIVDAASGAPIAGATLSLSDLLSASSGADGTVSIANVALGTYAATVSAPGYATGLYSVVLIPGCNGQLGTVRLYTATSDAAATTLTILGRVVNGLGNQPIAGATVTRTDTGETWTSGPDGSFTLSGLTTLSATLQIAATGYATQQFTFTASGYGTVSQSFVLPPSSGGSGATSVQLSGTVTDASTGAPVSGATVALANGSAQFVTGSTGGYQLPNIPNLSFNIQVSATGYVTQLIPVTVSQFGNYTLAIQLTPSAPTSTLQILSVDARSASIAASDTGVFTATVGNGGGIDVETALTAEITDASGSVVAVVGGKVPGSSNLASTFTAPANGQVQAEFDWAPKQLAAGAYTVTVYAATPGTATRDNPHGEVLASGNTSVSVVSSEDITGQLAFSPPLSQAGSQVPVAISALVVNSGNVPLDAATLHLTVTDPATNNVLYSADAQVQGLAVNNNVTLSFGSWVPTTTGNLKVHVAPTDGTVGGAIDGTLYVGNKATGSLTVDRSIVPPGSNTVHAKVAVQGVDLTQAISVDPLYFAVQRATTNAGSYVASASQAWVQSHRCVSCHIESQSLNGLSGAVGKATIDQRAINYLATAIASAHNSDGTIEDYAQGTGADQTQTTLNLWGLNRYHDDGEMFGIKLSAAMFLHSKSIVSGSQTHWPLDYTNNPPAWWETQDELTAIIMKNMVGVLQAAPGVDSSQVVSYSWNALTPAGFVSSLANELKLGPDGRLYALMTNGTVYWLDPVSGAKGSMQITGLPGTAYTLAIAPDGTFYIGGNGYVARVAPGQTVSTIVSRPSGILSIALSPSGVLYAADYSTNQLLRFDGATPTVVIAAGVLKQPGAIAFDAAGNLMIADTYNYDLIEYTADGTVKTFAAGMMNKPVRITSDGQDGWYVSTFYEVPLGYRDAPQIYHFNADGVGQELISATGNYTAGITMLNGEPVTIDLTQRWIETLVPQPMPVAADLTVLRQDVVGGAQYLLSDYQDGNTSILVQAVRIWGMAEARSVITDPGLQDQLSQAIAYLDAKLRGEQHTDGGWGKTTTTTKSDALVTAIVGLALDYSHPSPSDAVTRNAIQFLLNSQRGDGSWASADGIMSTYLASTGLVMDYLPDALQFLGGIDIDFYVQDVPGKASLSNFVPGPGSTIIGGDGSSTYNWHLTGVTSEQDVVFNVNLPAMLANETRPIAGSAYLQFKNSFTGELLTSNLDIPIVQAVSGLGLNVAVDRPQYPANTPVVISGTAGNGGLPTGNAQVQLEILAADGTVVADLPAITGLAIPTGGELPYSAQWNTGAYLAGAYTVKASILDDAGTVVTSASALFAIVNSSSGTSGSTEATLRTSTDRIVYNTTDTVAIADLVQSVTDNQILSLAHLHIVVTGPSGNAVETYDHDLGQLAPGAIQDVPDTLALQAAGQGVYTVTATLTDSTGATLASGTATFTVTENLARTLIGQVTVQSPSVYQGNPEVCTDTAINNGTQLLSGRPLQALVVSIAGQTAISTSPSTASLSPGQQQQSQQTVDTTALAVGGYACVLQAQVNGAWSTIGYATFQVTDPTAALAGTLAANPTQVPLTTAVSLPGGITNGGNATISGITATITIVDPSGNTVFTSPVGIASLAAGQANPLLASWVAVGNAGDVDTATLTASVGPKSRVLAQAQFTILPPPIKIAAALAQGSHGRVLILTDDPAAYTDDQDPFGPSAAPGLAAQNQHLKSVLDAAGWSYTLVTNAADFETEFDTGGYEVYLVLSEAVKLPTDLQNRVVAAVNAGAGLLVAGNHDDRNNKLEDALGIHTTGKSLNATGLSLNPNSLDQAGGQAGFPVGAEPSTVNKTSATAVGSFLLANGGTAPAVFTYGYGAGKSVYLPFDLALEEAAAGNDSLFDRLLLDSLNYVHPMALTPYTGRVLPIVLTLQNQGIATPGRAIVTLPAGVTVVDPHGALVSGNGLTWTFDLALGETLTETFWARMPDNAGTVPVSALVQSGTDPDYVTQASATFLIGVQAKPQ